ncbi:hypothetical protein Q1695_008234 [Nippostrongylus brasiliensis]|nr:hypothetical protein Q1695_008234 [Nippostrongylus brasiliensis]
MKFILLALCLYLCEAVEENNVHPELLNDFIPLEAQVLEGQALVDYLNENQNLFKAKLPPETHALKKKLMKSAFINQNHRPVLKDWKDYSNISIPDRFDAREQWPECPSLRYIRDQSNCGSCWAVSSAEAMSDRLCISTKGQKTVELSADELVSCCSYCGYGCDGGWPIYAWQYFAENGLVTGGNYGVKNACRPYEIHPCGRHKNQTYYGECKEDAPTPKCRRRCQRGYNVPYKKDKNYGKSAYQVPHSVQAIQREIMTNGPVVAAFTVYEDFAMYESGIYKHTAGRKAGGHAVKFIGWGEENGVPYWLVANSWNSDWGEDGYFRMIRGINNCGIEEDVVAGLV